MTTQRPTEAPQETPPQTTVVAPVTVSLAGVGYIAGLIQTLGFPIAVAAILLGWLLTSGDAKLNTINTNVERVVTAVQANTAAVERLSSTVRR